MCSKNPASRQSSFLTFSVYNFVNVDNYQTFIATIDTRYSWAYITVRSLKAPLTPLCLVSTPCGVTYGGRANCMIPWTPPDSEELGYRIGNFFVWGRGGGVWFVWEQG